MKAFHQVCGVLPILFGFLAGPPIHFPFRVRSLRPRRLQGFVSEWVPGLQIIAARVSKPTLPSQLQGDFVRVEEEISKLKV